MVLYECKICNYSSELKSNYSRHMKSKKHRAKCEMVEKNDKKMTPMTQNDPEMTPNKPQITQNDQKMTTNFSENSEKSAENGENLAKINEKKINPNKNKKKFKCDFCDKEFSTHAHKRRHELHTCKQNAANIYKLLNNQEAKIKILEKEKKELYKKIDALIKKVGDTNIQNSIQNNIIVNSYGNEDLSHITDKIKDELLKIPYGAIPKLIETIHFNDDMPQNMNIKYPNKKENVVSVYQGDKWVYKDKNETINDLIDSKYSVIDNHYENTTGELPKFVKHSYTTFKKVYEEGDEELVKNLKKECDMVLLNNRS